MSFGMLFTEIVDLFCVMDGLDTNMIKVLEYYFRKFI